MKTHQIILIFSCLFILSLQFTACNPSASSGLTEQDKEFFQRVTVNAYESASEGDMEPYVERYTEDAIYMVNNAETIMGKEAIRARVNALPRIRVEFPIVEILGTSDLAVTRGTFEIRDLDDNFMDKGKYVNIWTKNANGTWLVTHDIFNSDMPMPQVEADFATTN